MSTVTRTRRRFKLDGTTIGLMVIMAATQLVGLAVHHRIEVLSLTPDAQITTPVGATAIAAMAIGEALVIVGVWRLCRRLPEWVQWALKRVVAGSLVAAVGLGLWLYPVLRPIVAVAAVVVFVLAALVYYTNASRYRWFAHNVAAFGLSVTMVGVLAGVFAPSAVLVFLVLVMVWDYSAVSLSDLMADLVDFSASLQVPNYYIIPSAIRIDYREVRRFLRGERQDKPPGLGGIIGVGDFVLPSLLVASAALSSGAPWPAGGAAIATCVALGVLTASLDAADSGLPALVWLNSGAILGYSVGVAVVIV